MLCCMWLPVLGWLYCCVKCMIPELLICPGIYRPSESVSVRFFDSWTKDGHTCLGSPLIPGFAHDVISSLGKRLELVKYTGRIDRPHRCHLSGRRPESPGGKQINQPLTLFLSSIFTACLFLQQIMQTKSCNRFLVAKIICKNSKIQI